LPEKRRNALVAGPIEHSRVAIPLKHVDRTLDRSERLHALPSAVIKAGLLPSGGRGERAFPVRSAERERRRVDSGRCRQDFGDENFAESLLLNDARIAHAHDSAAANHLERQSVRAAAKRLCDIRREHMDSKRRCNVACHLVDERAVEVNFRRARSGQIQSRCWRHLCKLECVSEIVRRGFHVRVPESVIVVVRVQCGGVAGRPNVLFG